MWSLLISIERFFVLLRERLRNYLTFGPTKRTIDHVRNLAGGKRTKRPLVNIFSGFDFTFLEVFISSATWWISPRNILKRYTSKPHICLKKHEETQRAHWLLPPRPLEFPLYILSIFGSYTEILDIKSFKLSLTVTTWSVRIMAAVIAAWKTSFIPTQG